MLVFRGADVLGGRNGVQLVKQMVNGCSHGVLVDLHVRLRSVEQLTVEPEGLQELLALGSGDLDAVRVTPETASFVFFSWGSRGMSCMG